MHTINDIYFIKDFFSSEEVDLFCEKQNVSSIQGWDKALTVYTSESDNTLIAVDDENLRKSSLKRMRINKNDSFLMKLLYGVVEANEIKFKLNITNYLRETLTLLKYEETNDFFGPHKDRITKTDRLLSTIVLLSNPDDFEGGLIRFYSDKTLNHRFRLSGIQKGSLIIFPSDMFHEVTPVTKGIRFSLVMWSGLPWVKS